jgi:hypothetical protein
VVAVVVAVAVVVVVESDARQGGSVHRTFQSAAIRLGLTKRANRSQSELRFWK